MNIVKTLESFNKNTTDSQIKELSNFLYEKQDYWTIQAKLFFFQLVSVELKSKGKINLNDIYQLLTNKENIAICDELLSRVITSNSKTVRATILTATQEPIFKFLYQGA